MMDRSESFWISWIVIDDSESSWIVMNRRSSFYFVIYTHADKGKIELFLRNPKIHERNATQFYLNRFSFRNKNRSNSGNSRIGKQNNDKSDREQQTRDKTKSSSETVKSKLSRKQKEFWREIQPKR
jgi:hypothetical protein